MSLCPYGIKALGDLIELIRAFPQRDWHIWFVGTADGDKLSSLRGEEEMFDEKLWLGVKALYPFRYHEFLFLRSASKGHTEVLLEDMGLDVRKIRRWAEDMGSAELRQHYLRSMRLDINASPTLFVNNSEYKKPTGGGRLVREECKAAEPEPPFCSDYPECFEDSDCEAHGKIGACGKDEAGRPVCEFKEDVSFKLTVLVADTAIGNPEEQPLEAIKEVLPGARVSIVKLSSDEGQKLMKRHAPDGLPFFFFEKKAAEAHRFPSISEALVESGGGFTFKKGAVKTNYFPKREEKPGLAVLYADPLMPDIGKVITAFLSDPDVARRVALRPVLLRDPRGENRLGQDKLREEEALRWLVMANEFPKKYQAYLKIYAADPFSSYWFSWLKKIGVNQNNFLRRIEANKSKIIPYWEDFSHVSSGEPVMILINNRMKVPAANERELERILKSAGF
jgi:hypothetical protein